MKMAVSGPVLRPQAMSRDGDQSACARCEAGMCDGSVAYPPLLWDAQVRGDPAVLVEDLDGVGRDPNVDLTAAQRVGNAVHRVLDLDVIVDVDPRLAPLGVLVALGRERLERRPVQVLEPAAAAALELLERPFVQRGQERFGWPRGVRRARRTYGCAAAP